MDEAQIIAATPAPRTRQNLAADLRAAGIAKGSTVLVHAAPSTLGWTTGDPGAALDALLHAAAPARPPRGWRALRAATSFDAT